MKEVDFFTPGARLALELECLLMDTRNDAVQSRWWGSAHEALEQWRQAVRAMEAAIDAAQPEASITLEQAASHAHICSKLAEEHKHDVLLAVALTDAAAIIRDLMRGRLQASQAHPVPSDRALRLADECEESARAWAHEIDTRQRAADELRRLHAQAAQDEALLRQALEALERGAWNNLLAKDAVDTVIALRERLGKCMEQKA